MKRRSFIQHSSMAIAALSLSNQKLLSFLFEDPWKINMLTDDIGTFEERGGTILFYLSKKGIIVVDSQFPDQSKHLINELKKKTEKPFRLLINTHHHGDHSSGNISFKGLVQHVVAHANSKINQENVAKSNKTEDKQLYPDQTYTQTWCEKTGREKICLYYNGPAHTNGDSFVHFQHANIVHCGDLVFNRRHPVIDRSAGASIRNWIEVLNKGLSTFDRKTTYVFGHAAAGYKITGSADDLNKFRDYLGNLLKLVEDGIKAGKSKEEILKATTVPGSEEWKGDGLQRPLAAAWEEVSGK